MQALHLRSSDPTAIYNVFTWIFSTYDRNTIKREPITSTLSPALCNYCDKDRSIYDQKFELQILHAACS